MNPPESPSLRIRESDEGALAELFRATYADLLRYACSLGASESVAKDLVQEAFIRLWTHRHTLDVKRPVRTYLFVTLRNLAFNDHRRLRTHLRVHSEMPANLPGIPTPDGDVDARLLQDRLTTWIEDLPERRREAFELSRFAGLTLNEIAAVMDVSSKTVENHITEALRYLRRRLREFDPDLLTP